MLRAFRSFSILASVLACAALLIHPAAAQDVTRVEEIRLDPDAHANEIRTVEGVVDRLVNRGSDQRPSFYLEDDYGHQILVIPFDAAPARGDRVTVTGVVTLDPSGDPVLTLFDRDGPAPDPTQDVTVDADPTEQDTVPDEASADPEAELPPPVIRRGVQPRTLIFGAVFAFLLAVVAYRMGRKRDVGPRPIVTGPRKDDVDIATDALWHESEQEFDGRTMRFIRPDPTMQLLPARLEVVSGGDEGTHIPFVGKPGEDTDLMIGRSPGPGPSTVELKQKTVSRTHAVIRYQDDEWWLENLSMTNPTVLNDEILGVKQQRLHDGDRIEMGEVAFVFRSS